MRDQFIDVTVEFAAEALAQEREPSRFLLDLMRHKADEMCAQNFGRLRTDRVPEIIISRAVDPITGVEMVLAATRWSVVVPDAVAP